MHNYFLTLLISFASFFYCVTLIEEIPPLRYKSQLLELKCMELNLYHEARGELKAGIVAVGNVTINRTKDFRFPKTICGVVYQPFQFSWTIDKSKHKVQIPIKIKEIAYALVLDETIKDNTQGSLYFHNTDIEPFKYKYKMKIGNHIFYQ